MGGLHRRAERKNATPGLGRYGALRKGDRPSADVVLTAAPALLARLLRLSSGTLSCTGPYPSSSAHFRQGILTHPPPLMPDVGQQRKPVWNQEQRQKCQEREDVVDTVLRETIRG